MWERNELICLYAGMSLAGLSDRANVGQSTDFLSTLAVQLAEATVSKLEAGGYLKKSKETLECNNGEVTQASPDA